MAHLQIAAYTAFLEANAPPQLKAELLAGVTSINAAFMAVRRDTKRQDHRALIAATLPFPTGTYRTLLLDPPWGYRQRSGPHGAIDHYPTMTTAELAALPVGDLAAEDAVLLLWATWPMLPDALALIAAWGFTYKSALPWVKVFGEAQSDAPLRPHWGTGFWVRACSEPLLIATRGAARPPANPHLGLLSHRFEHSRKPDSAYELAEQFSGPYMELFARGVPRPGWTTWGAEVVAEPTENAVAADD